MCFQKVHGGGNEKALGMFYDSKTFELISERVADMHCMSDEYLVDELLLEYNHEL